MPDLSIERESSSEGNLGAYFKSIFCLFLKEPSQVVTKSPNPNFCLIQTCFLKWSYF